MPDAEADKCGEVAVRNRGNKLDICYELLTGGTAQGIHMDQVLQHNGELLEVLGLFRVADSSDLIVNVKLKVLNCGFQVSCKGV